MGPTLHTSGRDSSGAPVSSPATVPRHGGAVGRRLPEGARVRRGPARTPALHGAGAPYRRRSMRQGVTGLERRCPHRPTVFRHGGAVGRRLPEGPTVRRRPARTPALHTAGAPYVMARQFWSAGVLTGPRSFGTAPLPTGDCLRGRRCGAGRRGRRRSMGPALHTSGRASSGAPVSSPAHGPSARRCGRQETA